MAVELKYALVEEGAPDISQVDPGGENEVLLASLRKSLGHHVIQKEIQAKHMQRVLKRHRELRENEDRAHSY